MAKNILFIMSDQLRADYLSCAGHPTIKTPHIDALAARGVRFTHAYCQAPICGPSRMCFYTGRYMSSHGSAWNWVPLPIGERTLGDYLRPHGYRVAVSGKTHMAADVAGMHRLGIDPTTDVGFLLTQGGFEPAPRHDGIHATPRSASGLAYNDFLREQGYDSDNPWQEFANSVTAPDGTVQSGWYLQNADKPSRVADEHSETAFITDRAMDFIRDHGADPWCLHLSYIKPHWPYVAASPYHRLYGPDDCIQPVRHERELWAPHPVYQAFMHQEVSRAFARDEVRRTVVPTYMGLISQLDAHLGRLMAFLQEAGRLEDTFIVFTSDHGDYLGDHFLGEKELFHDCSSRIPLIAYDPDPAADSTRGTTDDTLVEAIDLLPTFLDAVSVEAPNHVLEGESLLPRLRGGTAARARDDVFSELDHAYYETRRELGLGPSDARSAMLRTREWKYVHHRHCDLQLFDLVNDPDELVDLGRDDGYAATARELHARLFERFARLKRRVTESDPVVEKRTGDVSHLGIYIGRW